MPFRMPGHRDEPPPVSTSELEGLIRKKRRRMIIAIVGLGLLFPTLWLGPHAIEEGLEWWHDHEKLTSAENRVVPLTPAEEARLAKIVDEAKARRTKEDAALKAAWPKLAAADVPHGIDAHGVTFKRCVSETERKLLVIDNTKGELPKDLEVPVGTPEVPVSDPRFAGLDEAIAREPEKARTPGNLAERNTAIDDARRALFPKAANLLVVAIDSWKNDRALARVFLWNTTRLRAGCSGAKVASGSTTKAIVDQLYATELAVAEGALVPRAPGAAPIEEDTTFQDSDESGAPIVAQKPAEPVLVKRQHTPGQRYSVLLRNVVDGNELVFKGATTVLEAKADRAKFSVTTETVKNAAGALVLPDTQFDVTASFAEWDFDAKEIGTRKAGPLLTHIEVLLGDECEPPDEAHRPGERWVAKRDKANWKMTGYDLQGGRAYASYTMESRDDRGDTFSKKMRLAVDNGFVGSCATTQSLALKPGLRSVVSWDLRVKRLPNAKLDTE